MKTFFPKYKEGKNKIPLPMDIVEDDVRNRYVFTFIIISFFMFIVINLISSSSLVCHFLINNKEIGNRFSLRNLYYNTTNK